MIKTIYSQKKNFIIIGLSGRIGSGCSTAAKFLSQTKKQHNIAPKKLHDKISDLERKRYILDKYYQATWKPFTVLKPSDVITAYILKYNFDDLNNILNDLDKKIEIKKARFAKHTNIKLFDKEFKYEYNNFHKKYKNILEEIYNYRYSTKKKKIKKLYNLITKELPKISLIIKEILTKKGFENYTNLYQLFGDNIRLYNDIQIKKQKAKNVFSIIKQVNYMIKIIRAYNNNNKKVTHITIDAIRNPLENLYLKERYSAYYLFSISANDEDIEDRLLNTTYITKEKLRLQKDKENPLRFLNTLENYASQNIKSCIEKSDIFIVNNGKLKDKNFKELHGQLIKYISLIKHPGLITPSLDEKMMQIAYTAKLNSGCLSRQVGASITNEYNSLKAIGWNSVADGQTPCLLRNKDELLNNTTSISFSKFEQSNKFKKLLLPIKNIKTKYGLNQSFCFKSIYTKNKEDETGNQVHTRSLHAEENAFMQLAKYGNSGIQKGTLYSTASPCELCSKKAYQLGIKRIVYIDPYPGIAREQILKSGLYPPSVELFKGAIGIAYNKLYEQIIPYKDELGLLK